MTSSATSTWVVLSYRLPSEPSRPRVAVWRELRRLGAVSIAAGAWAVPATASFVEGLERVVELVAGGGGNWLLLDASAHEDATAAALEEIFTGAREEEWREFLDECEKYREELRHEAAISKFTRAELDEEEESLERLRRWHRHLDARDVFGAASAPAAERALKECGQALDDYAAAVFRAVGES